MGDAGTALVAAPPTVDRVTKAASPASQTLATAPSARFQLSAGR